MTKLELARLIRAFVDGSVGACDWDDFTSVRQSDPEIEGLRRLLLKIRVQFPPEKISEYCSSAGADELTKIATALEEDKNLSRKGV